MFTDCRLLAGALLASLALTASPLLAQDPPQAGAADTTSAPAPEDTPDTPRDSGPGGDDDPSPFDYESSEEISRDLPVSFPVDI